MNTKERNLLIFAGIILLLAVLIIYYIFKPKIEVRTYTAGRGAIEEIVSSIESGSLEPIRRAKLRPPVEGKVIEILKREGERVKKGEVILRIDPEDALERVRVQRQNLELLRARAQSVEANLKNLSDKLEKANKLYAEGVVSDTQVKDLETQYTALKNELSAAESAIRQAESLLKLSENELKKRDVVAPFDGLITEINIREGEDVGTVNLPDITPQVSQLSGMASIPQIPAGNNYICEVIDDSSYYVEALFDESDAVKIKVGDPVILSSDAFGERTLSGRVIFVSPAVSGLKEGIRSVKVRTSLDSSADIKLLPGMSIDVDVIVRRIDNVILIPTSALVEKEGNFYVFLLDGKKARLRNIIIGISNRDMTEIKEGVREGDRIITTLDNPKLKDGVRVSIQDE